MSHSFNQFFFYFACETDFDSIITVIIFIVYIRIVSMDKLQWLFYMCPYIIALIVIMDYNHTSEYFYFTLFGL